MNQVYRQMWREIGFQHNNYLLVKPVFVTLERFYADVGRFLKMYAFTVFSENVFIHDCVLRSTEFPKRASHFKNETSLEILSQEDQYGWFSNAEMYSDKIITG